MTEFVPGGVFVRAENGAIIAIPPWVEYALMPLGRTPIEPPRTLASWAVPHRVDLKHAWAAYDQDPEVLRD